MTFEPDLTSIGDLLEEKLRDLLLAETGLDELKVVYRGDPMLVPVDLHPFGIVALLVEGDTAGERGMEQETGPVTYWKYEGMAHLEVLQRDVAGIVPDATRRADVPSYMTVRRLVQAARRAILGWAGANGVIPEANRVASPDGREVTLMVQVGRIENGLAVQTRADNVTNIGTFPVTVYTRKEEFE